MEIAMKVGMARPSRSLCIQSCVVALLFFDLSTSIWLRFSTSSFCPLTLFSSFPISALFSFSSSPTLSQKTPFAAPNLQLPLEAVLSVGCICQFPVSILIATADIVTSLLYSLSFDHSPH
ncbi:hypothetical protein RchiOBHm_Chr5g0010501 [Rosa chinensis]|uniref:Uncharacterized protein n=1 Tax=Rosa chinensis TaxID=74649 RepID=A0A2P6Q4R2_ROSCH|nr:hypothetical protein RchiOBHm_Chr5g0010501 [Rosa chinensis]